MTALRGWVECVPNFSEGRDAAVIEALRRAVESAGVKLLDRTSDPDHHRSVFTFAGRLAEVEDAVLRAAETAAARIDLTRHRGVHPRVGALDVVPLAPLGDTPFEVCADGARRLARRLWSRLEIPVYLYGRAALRPDRRPLERIRKLGFEKLRRLADSPQCRPDVGGPALHPTAGAACVGVRGFMVAFNVELRTADAAVAKRIAAGIRESSGGLPAVKALGLPLASRGTVQVSMNLTDIDRTPLHRAVEAVCAQAEALGVEVVRGELIGLLPAKAAQQTTAQALRLDALAPDMTIEGRLKLP